MIVGIIKNKRWRALTKAIEGHIEFCKADLTR